MPPEFFPWGGWWVLPIVMPIVMLVIALTFMYFVFGRGGRRPPWLHSGHDAAGGSGSPTAIEILKIRYAKGEITKGEFEQMRSDLSK